MTPQLGTLPLEPYRTDLVAAPVASLLASAPDLASQAWAVGETGMEHGGITPVGLPSDWPILLDRAVTEQPWVVVGSGLRRSKLVLPGAALAELPGAQVLDGLGVASS